VGKSQQRGLKDKKGIEKKELKEKVKSCEEVGVILKACRLRSEHALASHMAPSMALCLCGSLGDFVF